MHCFHFATAAIEILFLVRGKLNGAVGDSVDGVVLAHFSTFAGKHLAAALADDDIAVTRRLPGEKLNAESFGLGVSP